MIKNKKKEIGFKIIKKSDLADLERQLKEKDNSVKDAPKKISDLENVIKRKNNKISSLEQENDTKDKIIKKYEKSTEILEKNNNQLIKSLNRCQESEDLQKNKIQDLERDNDAKDQQIRTLTAKLGGVTKTANEQKMKLDNYKAHFKKEHVKISPSEYECRIKTVEQRKKELEK